MLAALGGIVLLIVGAILTANAVNDARHKRAAEEGPTPEEYWERYHEQYGADGPQGYGGPKPPDYYNPEGFAVGAALCFIGALILFIVA